MGCCFFPVTVWWWLAVFPKRLGTVCDERGLHSIRSSWRTSYDEEMQGTVGKGLFSDKILSSLVKFGILVMIKIVSWNDDGLARARSVEDFWQTQSVVCESCMRNASWNAMCISMFVFVWNKFASIVMSRICCVMLCNVVCHLKSFAGWEHCMKIALEQL